MKTKTYLEIKNNYPMQSAKSWINELAKEMTKRGYFGIEFYIDIINNDLIDYKSWLDMYYLRGLTPIEALNEDETNL